MADKVLCPWCGNEMWYPDSPWKRQQPEMGGYMYTMQGKCRHCGAMTSAAYGRTSEETVEKFFAAALHRYEPPCRPLTWKEVKSKYTGIDEGATVLVEENFGALWWAILDRLNNKIVAVWNSCGAENFHEDTYGKTWRCWPRKPTEQEREAYGWDDV